MFIVILNEDREHDHTPGRLNVASKVFHDERQAIAYAKGISSSRHPRVLDLGNVVWDSHPDGFRMDGMPMKQIICGYMQWSGSCGHVFLVKENGWIRAKCPRCGVSNKNPRLL